jgi:hypothetical protein
MPPPSNCESLVRDRGKREGGSSEENSRILGIVVQQPIAADPTPPPSSAAAIDLASSACLSTPHKAATWRCGVFCLRVSPSLLASTPNYKPLRLAEGLLIHACCPALQLPPRGRRGPSEVQHITKYRHLKVETGRLQDGTCVLFRRSYMRAMQAASRRRTS